MIEASNLGQIIGRALYGELPSTRPMMLEELPIVRRLGYRQRAVLELLRSGSALSLLEISKAIDIGRHEAVAILGGLARTGLLTRSGTRRLYVYSLPKVEV
jgi:hypothetical protein